MLDWHIGMVETEDGRPRNLGPADACTLARVWLVPAAADAPAPWMCALAFATDGARRAARAGGRADAHRARPRGARRLGVRGRGAVAARVRRGWLGRGGGGGELARLGAGLGYALVVWFGSASAPDPRVLHAARVTTPLRAGGLVAAGLGHRRSADALVVGGAAWSALAIARALRRRARRPPAPRADAGGRLGRY